MSECDYCSICGTYRVPSGCECGNMIENLNKELEELKNEVTMLKRVAQEARNEVTLMENKCVTYERKLQEVRGQRNEALQSVQELQKEQHND